MAKKWLFFYNFQFLGILPKIAASAYFSYRKIGEKPNIKKLNFIPPSKFWGIGSLAVVAIGGSSLLKIQSIQNSYKGVNTSQVNIKTENQSTKSLLSMAQIKSSNQSQTKIKKISYFDPLLSTNNSSENNNFLQVQPRRTEDFFSF